MSDLAWLELLIAWARKRVGEEAAASLTERLRTTGGAARETYLLAHREYACGQDGATVERLLNRAADELGVVCHGERHDGE